MTAHGAETPPSPWLLRFASLIPAGGDVLDLAAGRGRHGRRLMQAGHRATFVDIDVSRLADLVGRDDAEIVEADLENAPWPLDTRRFAAVVVTNYLHRPLLPRIVAAVAPGGLLIYETFALGNERFGRPTNPEHLLKPGELLEAVSGQLRVLAYEDLVEETPRPAARQRICARHEG